MYIRAATEQDTSAIVNLLRSSLGEQSSTKSEEYWKWKHICNPFGTSPILVAEDDGTVVAVRAMMQWQWNQGNQTLRALRAVDTATHPSYQGKGFFSKLTMQMVEQAKAEGYHFIFNTPNKQSKPGYLKMGWQEAGRLSIGLRFIIPFTHVKSQTHLGGYLQSTASVTQQSGSLEELCREWCKYQSLVASRESSFANINDAYKKISNHDLRLTTQDSRLINLFTPKTPAYLHWRYRSNPVVKYSIREKEDFYIAACLRRRSFIRELRIAEIIWREKPEIHKKINKVIEELAGLHRANVVSFAPQAKPMMRGLKGIFPYGPLVTVRNLNMPSGWEGPNCWNFAVGDFELF